MPLVRFLAMSALLIMNATTSQAIGKAAKRADLFDHSLSKKVTLLPPDPTDPQAKQELSCLYFPKFMVKQIDFGRAGGAALSIIPVSKRGKRVACREQNDANEKVMPDFRDGGWNGYFKGVKGNYVFFDADDSWGGGLGFAIYDGIDGQKIFDDVVVGDFRDIRLSPTSIILKYERADPAPCSMGVDETGCWRKILQDTGFANATPPDCAKVYKDTLDAEIERRIGVSRQQIIQDTMEVPTVLHYKVTTKLENGQKIFIPAPDKIECTLPE